MIGIEAAAIFVRGVTHVAAILPYARGTQISRVKCFHCAGEAEECEALGKSQQSTRYGPFARATLRP